jgi:hypothetical protein
MLQKFTQFGVQVTGSIVAIGVTVFLVLAWVFTSPLIQLVDEIAGGRKVKTKNK